MKKFTQYIKENYISLIVKFVVVAVIIALDLITKSLSQNMKGDKTFIPNVISFSFVKNTGAAFGIFENGSAWLAIFSVIFLIVFVLYDLGNKEQNWFSKLGFAFIFSGAIGNMIDRIFLGYVRDFISFDFINFPVFNVADVAITIGCGLYVIYLITYVFDIRKKKKIEKTTTMQTNENTDDNKEI